MRRKRFHLDCKSTPDPSGNCHGGEELVLEIIEVRNIGNRQKATPYSADFSLIWVDATRRKYSGFRTSHPGPISRQRFPIPGLLLAQGMSFERVTRGRGVCVQVCVRSPRHVHCSHSLLLEIVWEVHVRFSSLTGARQFLTHDGCFSARRFLKERWGPR